MINQAMLKNQLLDNVKESLCKTFDVRFDAMAHPKTI